MEALERLGAVAALRAIDFFQGGRACTLQVNRSAFGSGNGASVLPSQIFAAMKYGAIMHQVNRGVGRFVMGISASNSTMPDLQREAEKYGLTLQQYILFLAIVEHEFKYPSPSDRVSTKEGLARAMAQFRSAVSNSQMSHQMQRDILQVLNESEQDESLQEAILSKVMELRNRPASDPSSSRTLSDIKAELVALYCE